MFKRLMVFAISLVLIMIYSPTTHAFPDNPSTNEDAQYAKELKKLPDKWQVAIDTMRKEIEKYIETHKTPKTRSESVAYLKGLEPIFRRCGGSIPIANIQARITGYSKNQALYVYAFFRKNKYDIRNLSLYFEIFQYRKFIPKRKPPRIPHGNIPEIIDI